jgi:hypothetical protein
MGDKKMDHSKLPWEAVKDVTAFVIYSADYDIAAVIDTDGPDKANAEFIVKACNEHDTLKADNKRLRDRDCNATIELCYDNSPGDPFAREELKVVDVGVSDNCYVVESVMINTFKAKADLFDELVAKIDSFEAQREGNPQPVLLEFAWNEVIETHKKAKELK